MKPSRGVDASDIRKANRRAVVQALREHPRVGRKQVADMTQLSMPTISRVVGELIEQSIVAEVGYITVANAKRRTALLDINPGVGWIIAMEVGGSHIRAAAMDMSGELYDSMDYPLENVQGEATVTPAIHLVLTELLGKNYADRGMPMAVGVSCAGVVDPEMGVVTLSFNLHLQNYPVARVVKQVVNVPVVVANNIVAPAFAESRLGYGRECADFAYISVGAGIGARCVFHGQVQHLPNRAEFGLMVVAPEGDPERFGGRGYLESLASGRGIAVAARHELEKGSVSMMNSMLPHGRAFVTAKTVDDAAIQGDDVAVRVMSRAAEYLGIGIVNLAHTQGITRFVMNGGVARSGAYYWRSLQDAIERHSYWPGVIEIQRSQLTDNAPVLGAGLYALDEAFRVLTDTGEGSTST